MRRLGRRSWGGRWGCDAFAEKGKALAALRFVVLTDHVVHAVEHLLFVRDAQLHERFVHF